MLKNGKARHIWHQFESLQSIPLWNVHSGLRFALAAYVAIHEFELYGNRVYIAYHCSILVLIVSHPTHQSLFSFMKHTILLFLNLFVLCLTSPHVSLTKLWAGGPCTCAVCCTSHIYTGFYATVINGAVHWKNQLAHSARQTVETYCQ